MQEGKLENLFRDHYSAVLAYARRRAPHAIVDDVVAETFLVAWRRIDDVPSNALPWLLSVARRTLSTHLRSARRRLSLIERLMSVEGNTPSAHDVSSTDASVITALGRLPEKDQEALTLVAWDGLKPREAALVMGEASAKFRVRLHRAKRRLRRELDGPGMDFPNQPASVPVTREGIAK